jgi:excisionase family DNA binding protein
MDQGWNDEFFTVTEVAEHLKLNPQTIRNWIDQGRLPALKIGRRVRIRRSELDRVLDDGVISVAAPDEASGPGSGREELVEAIEQGRRVLDRQDADRRELAAALRAVVDAALIALHGPPDPPNRA